jgi:hypothetical protein
VPAGLIVSEPDPDQNAGAWTGIAGAGLVALAIGCCAALPLIAALAGGAAVGTVLGVGAGAAVLIALVGLILFRARRRAACETSEAPRPGGREKHTTE